MPKKNRRPSTTPPHDHGAPAPASWRRLVSVTTNGWSCTQYESNHIVTKAKQDFVSLAVEHQLRRQKHAGAR